MLTDRQLEHLSREWKRTPLPALASQLGVEVLDLTAALREKGVLTEVQPQELQFIQANLDRIPPREIRARLGMSPTQFSQICGKILRRSTRKSGAALTIEEVIAKTRWLIEEKLQLPRDDFLPRTISNQHFAEHGLYHCTRFAEQAKAADALYRHFSAVAFLVCVAYPGQYRPFQFRHAKQNDYFKGRDGRRNILNAVRWAIERKLQIAPEHVPMVAGNKYFLRSADLQFYGVGSHWYLQHFASRKELIGAVLKLYGQPNNGSQSGSSTHLRNTLAEAGRPVSACEAPGCYYDDEFGLDVHHIIPRASGKARRIALHGPNNLVVLCPNHHRIARTFPWTELDFRQPESWRLQVLEFLATPDARDAANNGSA